MKHTEMKLIKRSGDFRTYSDGITVVEIKLCLNPNVYVNTGYYLTFNNAAIPLEIMNRRFSSGKRAAEAVKKFLGK